MLSKCDGQMFGKFSFMHQSMVCPREGGGGDRAMKHYHQKFLVVSLVVMIAVKDTKSVSFLKLEPFIFTGSTNDFL